MIYSYLLPLILIAACSAYMLGRSKSLALADKSGGIQALHSLPCHYGTLAALWCALPALSVVFVWHFFESSVITSFVVKNLPAELAQQSVNQLSLTLNDIKNIVSGDFVTSVTDPVIQRAADHYLSLQRIFRNSITGIVLFIAVFMTSFIVARISPALQARNMVEKLVRILLILCSAIAILTTIGIFFSVIFESIRFFKIIPLQDFIFGLEWSPQVAIRADQAGSSGAFGAIPIFAGTLLITFIAMTVAAPIGLMAAIYLSEYATPAFRTIAKPTLEILAGIPTVVYGFFAALTVAPFIRNNGALIGLDVSSESALAAGLVMGIMIIPFISSLSDDVIHAVPQALRDGSLGLGATKFETIRLVLIPAALPGIVGGILLAISRAIGETMIVVMAAGLSANLTANPLQAVTTVTVQIVTLLVGDQEFDSPKTLAAFALGLLLFVFTLFLNFGALKIVKKYREQYD